MTDNQTYQGRVAELRQRGILPSREEMMRISESVARGMEEEHYLSYYRPGEKQPIARKITEEDWRRLGEIINSAAAL